MPTSRETTLAAPHARLSTLPAMELPGEVQGAPVTATSRLELNRIVPDYPEITVSLNGYNRNDFVVLGSVARPLRKLASLTPSMPPSWPRR